MSKLVTPKRVFFDTNHLIEMSNVLLGESRVNARRVAAYDRLLSGLCSGEIAPVIAFRQPIEWHSGGAAAAHQIAAVLDRAPVRYLVGDHLLVYMLEALREALRLYGVSASNLPEVLYDITARNEFNHFFGEQLLRDKGQWLGQQARIDAKWRSVRHIVDEQVNVAVLQRTDIEVERFAMYEVGLSQTQDGPVRRGIGPRDDVIGRLRRTEPFLALLRQFDIDPENESVWRGFELSNCPALRLGSALWLRHASHQKGRKADPNDADDVSFVPAYVYSDFALVEKSMRHLVHSSDQNLEKCVFSDAVHLIANMFKRCTEVK